MHRQALPWHAAKLRAQPSPPAGRVHQRDLCAHQPGVLVLSRGQLAVESSTRQVEFAADHYLYRMSGNAHAASQYPASASSATQHTSHPQARALPPPATHCPHHYQKVAECGRVQANRIPEHTQESRGTGAAATPRCSTHSPVTSHGSRKSASSAPHAQCHPSASSEPSRTLQLPQDTRC